jgi:hypothetical protein
MSTPATPYEEGLDAVVGKDGVLTVPADELARHGLRPGTHVRLIPKRPSAAPRRIVRGALRAAVDAATLDAFEAALDEAKADRIATVDRRWR